MQAAIHVQPAANLSQATVFKAVICEKCGAKIYPAKLLKSHQHRHRLMQQWFDAELKRLRKTIKHMRAL
jgi:hypothetical protein